MKAKSIKGKSAEEIEQSLYDATHDGFSPTLAIVFISIKQDLQAITKLLSQKSIAVYGATSNGEFIDEEYKQGTIAMLLLDINPSWFFIQFADLDGKHDRQTSHSLAEEAMKKFNKPAFIVTGSNLQTDIEELLAGFIDVVGKEANIVGGMAGDDHTFLNQYVFTNKALGSRSVLSLVIDEDKVLIKGRATHGWTAVGTEKTVTQSEGNRVYTIDNIPTLDLCLKYSGLPVDHPQLVEELVTNFPLQLQRENGGPLMRPAYHINWEDHSMLTSGRLPVGSRVRFSLPPDFDVIGKVIDENKKMKETELPDPDALIIYNCGGRLMSLGPLISEEIKGMKNVWNVPMAGMFSNAEIGRTPNGNLEMHNLTTCWVVLKEKK
jgi:hypothetical protein